MGEKDIDLLTKIGEVCLNRGVFIIDDLVYRDISYDKDNLAKPIATIPGMFRNTISLFGLSKSYGLASVRAGFVVADELIIREIVNRIFQEIDSSSSLTAYSLAGAFNNTPERKQLYDEYFTELREEYDYQMTKVEQMYAKLYLEVTKYLDNAIDNQNNAVANIISYEQRMANVNATEDEKIKGKIVEKAELKKIQNLF